MKYLSIIIVLILSSICVAAPPDRVQFKDGYGRYTGSATTRGRYTDYTNRYGQRVGSAYTNGNRTQFRDSYGRNAGSAYGKFNPTTQRPKSFSK